MAAQQYCAGRVPFRCGRACLEWSPVLLFVALLGLTGCASTESPVSGAAIGNVPLECAPFARAVSGVQLRGAAADWWPQAEGRYRRTQTPAVGSVLVFRRSTVSACRMATSPSSRASCPIGGSWRPMPTGCAIVSEDVPVIDVSPGNDWTKVRVWCPSTDPAAALRLRSTRRPRWCAPRRRCCPAAIVRRRGSAAAGR
jgi:hypothetical protein